MNAPTRLQESMESNTPWLFLSPHLDDAVLSCAGLMSAFATRRKITVATLFTEAEPPPHTRAARAFLDQCKAHSADSLFAARRNEDETALADLRVRHRHLGAPDALFRRHDKPRVGLGPLAKMLPELMHLYPTYRFDIALGRVARGDRALIGQLRDQVSDLLIQTGAGLIFCPLGVGRHVDHLITRLIGTHFPGLVVYYSDFPYSLSNGPDTAFIRRHRLQAWQWETDASKHTLIHHYASQVPALFPGGQIPTSPETYFAAN